MTSKARESNANSLDPAPREITGKEEDQEEEATLAIDQGGASNAARKAISPESARTPMKATTTEEGETTTTEATDLRMTATKATTDLLTEAALPKREAQQESEVFPDPPLPSSQEAKTENAPIPVHPVARREETAPRSVRTSTAGAEALS